jgi:hypothetical protein
MTRKTRAALYTFIFVTIIAAMLSLAFYYPQISIRILLGVCMVTTVYCIYMIIYTNLKD